MTDGSTARSRWRLTPAAFEKLLDRLDPHRETAGAAFEDLRRRLILFFSCEGLSDPESWADETLDRVAKRLEDGSDLGNIAAFTKGVARLVRQEARQARFRESRATQELKLRHSHPPDEDRDSQVRHHCLEACLATLNPDDRALVFAYYEGEKRGRIENRKRLAAGLGIAVESLRNRALGIRKRLEACMTDCAANPSRINDISGNSPLKNRKGSAAT